MSDQAILTDQSEGVLTITINRPDRMNALTEKAGEELTAIVEAARHDDAVRAVVLTGAGRAFCAGADLGRPRPPEEVRPREDRLDELKWYGRLALALGDVDRPLIAAIPGPAVGAGLGIALACDIRIASTAARFSSIFVKRGLSPDTGTSFYLPRLIGPARAFEAIYTGRMIDAEEAERIGLVNRVVVPEELLPAAQQLAAEIAAGPPIALMLSRRVLQQSLANDLPNHLRLEGRSVGFCTTTDDFREGVAAFLEKRAPRFTGR